MQINRTIFREYDVRGLVGKDLTPDFAYWLGRGCATYFKNKNPQLSTVSIGYDARESSPDFAKNLIRGFNDSGIDTICVGMVPTGLLYFTLFNLPVQGGIQITGSHNPPEYNGFKINLGDLPVYGPQIQEIADIMEKDAFLSSPAPGTNKEYNIIPDYEKYIQETIHIENPGRITIVVDSGNGVGGFVAVPLMRKMGINVISLFEEPDGTFPNHHPDPTVVEYIQDLIKTTKQSDAQFGIGFDGDADRIGVVDKHGEIIWGDMILDIFARSVLKEVPGATIVGDVKCSKTLYDDIRKHGGNPLMYKTGHSLIKREMKQVGAALGGEMSGHIFFKYRFFGYDDAIYAAFRLLEIVSRQKEIDIDALLTGIPKLYSTPEIRIEVDDTKKFGLVRKVADWFKDNGYEVNDIDGARITFDDGWGLIRASNTQNVIVMRFEASSKERLEEIQNLIQGKLHEIMES